MPQNIITVDPGPVSLPFNDIEITESINNLPMPFGQLEAEGMFPTDALTSQYFEIDLSNDVLSALPITNEGPATIARHGSGDARIFKVPRIEHQDDIRSSDIRGWLDLARRSRNGDKTLVAEMNKRLLLFKRKFALTLELMRMAALKGVIIDGKGTQIYDLFGAFNLTKKVVYFDLGNANADIQGACDLLYALITQDLADESMTGIEARVSRQFFGKLVQHPKVEKFWLNSTSAQALVNLARGEDGQYRPRTFEVGSVTFKESLGVVPMWGGTNQPLVAAGKGHAYPTGTQDSHKTYVSPPDDIRELDGGAADTSDLMHVTQEPMKHGKGVELLGQMNALPFWRRPKLLVELDDASGTSTTPIN